MNCQWSRIMVNLTCMTSGYNLKLIFWPMMSKVTVPQPLIAFFLCNCLVWFHCVFYFGPFFFEQPCLVSGRKTCIVTAERYLMLLCDHVVPSFQERHASPVVSFMQDGAPPHIAHGVKSFLLESSPKTEWSRGCKIQWSSRSPDLNPVNFWLCGS